MELEAWAGEGQWRSLGPLMGIETAIGCKHTSTCVHMQQRQIQLFTSEMDAGFFFVCQTQTIAVNRAQGPKGPFSGGFAPRPPFGRPSASIWTHFGSIWTLKFIGAHLGPFWNLDFLDPT